MKFEVDTRSKRPFLIHNVFSHFVIIQLDIQLQLTLSTPAFFFSDNFSITGKCMCWKTCQIFVRRRKIDNHEHFFVGKTRRINVEHTISILA